MCLTNGYAAGFVKGRIYQGASKKLCLPGLNCYSCPGALGSCPIGSLQAVLGTRGSHLSFYVTGFLLFTGALFGRFVCGFLCPFGLVQDLLHKIPFVKKIRVVPGDRFLRLFKYFVLAVFVVLLPMFALDAAGQGQPWFCKYICPEGTLFAGIPLIAANPPLRAVLGWLFTWKAAVLFAVLAASVFIYRPFCRYVCPLGAVYSLFNPIAVFRYRIDADACTACGACKKACPMDIDVMRNPNSAECIRCGKCRKACPSGAIKMKNKMANPFRRAMMEPGGKHETDTDTARRSGL